MAQKQHTVNSVEMKQYRENNKVLTESEKTESVGDKEMQKKCNFVVTKDNYNKLTVELKNVLSRLVKNHSSKIVSEGSTFNQNTNHFAKEVNMQLKHMASENDKIGKNLNVNVKLMEKSTEMLVKNKNPSEDTIKQYVDKSKQVVALLRSNLNSIINDTKSITKLVDEFDRKISTLGSKKVQDELSIDTATSIIDVSNHAINGTLNETSGSPFNKKVTQVNGILTKINTKTKEYTIIANGRPFIIKKICVE